MKNIKEISNSNLIAETKRLVAEERRLTAEVINYLCEVNRRRLYAEHGYSSMFMFCVKFLGYPEAQAQRRIEAMRAVTEIPELEEKIKTGSLSLTAVAQAQSFFRIKEKENEKVSVEEKREIFEKLEHKSTRECERELVKLAPRLELPRDKVRLVSETHSQMTTMYPNELLEKLNRIKNIWSHKNPNMTQPELLNEMAEFVLDRVDPLRKGERYKGRDQSTMSEKQKNRDVSGIPAQRVAQEGPRLQRGVSSAPEMKSDSEGHSIESRASGANRKMSAPITRTVIQSARGKCSFVSPVTGECCDSEYQLELDHIVPVAKGGTSDPVNLRLLCRKHNQLMAIKHFGRSKMSQYLELG